jgi:UDP-N-acetylglucosamine--dolichyl-phosphate N-acetylglucosaminephosphotransferase
MTANSFLFLASLALLLAAFVATYLIMPWLIAALRKAEITGRDVHKPDTPEVPTMGGIGVFVGFAAAMTLSALLGLDYRLLFAIFLSGTLALVAGLIDDLFRLDKMTLIIITFLVSMPVVAFRAGSTFVYLTPVGPADLGWVFWFLVPFAFAFAMNGVNIFAGFNGLEAGLGAVSTLSLGVCALLYGSTESAVALFALGGGLVAFLRWNWFPAKLLMGGSGTFLIGAVLASSIISGTIKIVGLIVLLPYIANFVLRASDGFRWTVGETLQNGLVKSGKRTAVWALFMHNSPTTERQVVLRCLAVQVLFGLLAITFAYYHATFIVPRLG